MVIDGVVVVAEFVNESERARVAARPEVQNGSILRADPVTECPLIITGIVVAVLHKLVCVLVEVDFGFSGSFAVHGSEIIGDIVPHRLRREKRCARKTIKKTFCISGERVFRRIFVVVQNRQINRLHIFLEELSGFCNVFRGVVAAVNVFVSVVDVVIVTGDNGDLIIQIDEFLVKFENGFVSARICYVSEFNFDFGNAFVEFGVSVAAVAVGRIESFFNVVCRPAVFFAEEVFTEFGVVNLAIQRIELGYKVRAIFGNGFVKLGIFFVIVDAIENVRVLILLDKVNEFVVESVVFFFKSLVLGIKSAVFHESVSCSVVAIDFGKSVGDFLVQSVDFCLSRFVKRNDEFVVIVSFARSAPEARAAFPLARIKTHKIVRRRIESEVVSQCGNRIPFFCFSAIANKFVIAFFVAGWLNVIDHFEIVYVG